MADYMAYVPSQVAEEEAALWDAEGAGFLRLDYDRVTQQRLCVAINNAASWQYGTTGQEEALARFAMSDLALIHTEMDTLRYFAVDLGEKAPRHDWC